MVGRDCRSSIVRYPGDNEGLGNGGGGHILDGYGFGPFGKLVNHRQNVGVTLVGWEGTNHIEIYMLEVAV